MVSEVDDTGPCFTDEEKAKEIAKKMTELTEDDGTFYVTYLRVDPSDEEAIRMLERPWHPSAKRKEKDVKV